MEYAFPKKKAGEKARVIFFIAPGCRSCPDEAVKLERELKRLGVDYEIEGVFLGDPSQVGAYLAELRGYPFNFEIGVDMDGSITRGYGVKAFPSAVIEMGGKRIIVTRSDDLEGKIR
ncbi:MAG: redoxin domain-containing protein [Deltaproteobacteria bacterium]|nr:redoxin domain-containing protein [Deltaproteobacteria bacterium]